MARSLLFLASVLMCVIIVNGVELYSITGINPSYLTSLNPETGEMKRYVHQAGMVPEGVGSMAIDTTHNKLFMVYDGTKIQVYDLKTHSVVGEIDHLSTMCSELTSFVLLYYRNFIYAAGPCGDDLILAQINPINYNHNIIRIVSNLTKEHEYVPGWSTFTIATQSNYGYFNVLTRNKKNPKDMGPKLLCFSIITGKMQFEINDPYYTSNVFTQPAFGSSIIGIGGGLTADVYTILANHSFVIRSRTKDLDSMSNVVADPVQEGVFYATQKQYDAKWNATNVVLTLFVDPKNVSSPLVIRKVVKFALVGTQSFQPIAIL